MPTTPTPLPTSAYDSTYLARLQSRGPDSPKGRFQATLTVLSASGVESTVSGYFESADSGAMADWFLVKRLKQFKPDGDLFRAFPYSQSPKDRSTFLGTYLTPAAQRQVSRLAGSAGSLGGRDDYARLHADMKAAASQKPSVDPAVFEVGPKPYFWTAMPAPHWAFVEFEKRFQAGVDLPEILQPSSYLRIGTVAFRQAVGPMDLQITESAQVSALPVMRQSESMKRVSGNIRKAVTFTLQFPNGDSLSQELVPFLRQCRRAPFVPVIHSELYQAGIDGLAIESVEVGTVEGFPEVLQVQVRALQFNWRRYLNDADEFDLCLNYPLFDVWLAYPGEGADAVPYYVRQPAPSDTSLPWTSALTCYTPSRKWLSAVNDNSLPTDVEGNRELYLRTVDNTPHNLLYDAVIAIQTGTGNVPAYTPGQKLTTVARVKGLTDVQALEAGYSDNTIEGLGTPDDYIAVPLSSPALMEAGFAPTLDDGADYVLFEPRTVPWDDSVFDLSQNLIDDSTVPMLGGSIGKRSAAYAQMLAGHAQYTAGYWGFWKVGRRVSAGVTDRSQDPLDSPLGVAAQLTFLDPSEPVFEPVSPFVDLVVTGVRASLANTLAEFSPEDEETPSYQHMGSSDITVTFEGVCPEDTARTMEDFMREVSALSVDYRGQWDGSAYGGYCRIGNELARLVGVQEAIPVSLTVDTIPNFPSERRVTLTLVSFDPTQRRINIPQDFGTDHTAGQAPGAADTEAQPNYDDQSVHYSQYLALEKHVRHIDLYPDIRPPLWTTLKKWVSDLRDGKVWDYASGRAFPDYAFLLYWNYPEDYWPSASSKGFLGVINDGDNPRTWEDFQPPDLNVYGFDGKAIAGAERTGFADPDFYCASRGDSRKATGADKIEAAARSLLGDNAQFALTQARSIHWGSDGTHVTIPWGSKDLGFTDTASTLGAVDAKMGTIGPDGKSRIKPFPAGAAPDNGQGQISNSPADSDNTPSAVPINTAGLATDDAHGGKYLAQISQVAQQTGVPAAAIQALIKRESGGDPTQIGVNRNKQGVITSYDYGLMQINNRTKDPSTYDWKDPGANIAAAAEIFKGKLSQAHGNMEEAFQRYNGYNGQIEDYGRSVYSDYLSLSQGGKDAFARAKANPAIGSNTLPPSPFKSVGDGTGVQLGADLSGFVKTVESIPKAVESIFGGPAPDAGADRKQDADIRTWDVDRATYDADYGEDVFYAYRRSEMTGRLVQAYPTFLVLLSSGGPVFKVWRLFDVFYGLHSAMKIECFSSRKTAADACTVAFADPYNTLSARAADVQLAKENDTRRIMDFADGVEGTIESFYPGDDLARRREEELRTLLIRPGNRLHVRLGYGSDAASLPTVFNGTIAGVRRQSDMIEVVAEGDGAELTNPLSPNTSDQGAYVRSGTAGNGETLRNIILSFFTATDTDIPGGLAAAGINFFETKDRAGIVQALKDSFSKGYYLGGNPYGIVHFGTLSRGVTITDTSEVGVNIYSGWSDHPVNVTYASDDGPLVLDLLPGIYHAVETDIPQSVRDNFSKFIGKYEGNGFADNMDEAAIFRRFQGEPIVGIDMEKATPWDVISQLRYVAADYVRQVHPFGLRSTLFFGKSYWPLHYQYDFEERARLTAQLAPPGPGGLEESLKAFFTGAGTGDPTENAAEARYGSSQSGTSGNPLDNAEVVYRRRPYLQVHVAHSGTNLLASEIQATSEGWSTIVQSQGTCCGLMGIGGDQIETSFAEYLDVNIFPEFQRLKLVKSGLYSSQEMRYASTGYSLATSMPWLRTDVLNSHAVGVLHDEVREMYQGSVAVVGNGWVRPFHLYHLDDEMKKMQGLFEVREVTHTFSPQGGFVTVITPDACANAADPSYGLLWGHAVALVGRVMIGNRVLRTVSSSAGRFLLRRAFAQMVIAPVDKIDHLFASKIGGSAKFSEFYLSKSLRVRWRRNIAGKAVQKVAGRVHADGISIKGFTVRSARKGLSQRQELRDRFEAELKLRSSRGLKDGLKEYLGSGDYARFIRTGKAPPKLYDEILADITEREFQSRLDALDDEAKKGDLTPIRDEVEAYVQKILGGYRPKTDEAGNVIEDDRVMEVLRRIVDPYHGGGSLTGDAVQAYKDLRDKKRTVQWVKGIPRLSAVVDPELIAQIGVLEGEQEQVAILESLADAKDRSDLEAVRDALHKLASAEPVGNASGALEQEAAKQVDDLNAKIEADQVRLDALSALKDPAEIKRGRTERHRLKVAIRSRQNLRARLLKASQSDTLAKAEALARQLERDEKASRIVKHVLSTYGRWVPGDQAKIGEAAAKVISGLGKGGEGVARVGGRVADTTIAKGVLTALGVADPELGLGVKLAGGALNLMAMGGLTWLDRGMISRHALFVTPLRSCGREFSAGINGHRGLCAGDTLGPMDSIIAYFCDDTKSPALIGFLTGLLGLGGVHYLPDKDHYQKLMDGLGIRTDETPADATKRYQDHLAQLESLNALGFNLKLASGYAPDSLAGGYVSDGPVTILKDRKGKLVRHYSSVVTRLNQSASLGSSTLVGPEATGAGFCARAVKEALGSAGITVNYKYDPLHPSANPYDAITLGNYLAHDKAKWEPHGVTPFSQVPDGAVCFWDNAGKGDGHVGFAMSDSRGRYILGNTEGVLKYRSVSGEFSTVTRYFLPKSTND